VIQGKFTGKFWGEVIRPGKFGGHGKSGHGNSRFYCILNRINTPKIQNAISKEEKVCGK
jgi:hypothetical protein